MIARLPLTIALSAFLMVGPAITGLAEKPVSKETPNQTFDRDISAFFAKYCHECHNADDQESGISVDELDGKFEDRRLPLWNGIIKQVSRGKMPPKGSDQPSAKERKDFSVWAEAELLKARKRVRPKNGQARRLTVTQYRNTVRELLGLEEDLSGVLPADGISKDGFTNNGQTLLLSPLLLEAYFDIAERALDLTIVDENQKPVIQTFRMELGRAINSKPCPDKLILGANSLLLANQDFVVSELQPKKPFSYKPFSMQKSFRFIEGYQGNATVRGWREFNSIYHAVFACMRGTPGYPRGLPYETAPEGLLLRASIPSPEIWQQGSTYGPYANFKVSLRELPRQGNFIVRVKAARYEDGLLLNHREAPLLRTPNTVPWILAPKTKREITIPQDGIYQVDIYTHPGYKNDPLRLQLDNRYFTGRMRSALSLPKDQRPTFKEPVPSIPGHGHPFMLVRLKKGPTAIDVRHGQMDKIAGVALRRLKSDDALAKRFVGFERRYPRVGVHVGLRRDCGSTLAPVGGPQTVKSSKLQTYVFRGAINNFPSPDVEDNNVNYLAGVREIGVRHEYTDGREKPRLLLRSIEFEGPYYETWPPKSHQRIFFASQNRRSRDVYAKEVITQFAERAYRRPLSAREVKSLMSVYQQSMETKRPFQSSVKDALLVVLTSPQFLFLIENSQTPKAEDLGEYELASKLSYFLWNSPPDKRLLAFAAQSKLRTSLDREIDRMIADPRFDRFATEFASQWLSLDKFDVVKTDTKLFSTLTRDTKAALRREPVETLKYLIRQNLPARQLVQSDIIMANEAVAKYYGLAEKTESGFDFLPIRHGTKHLGGLLTQASILAGLSDGRESNPVKRGAWVARKIVAEPPDDPPPNVPQLMEDDTKLTLRQKLERHRNQKGCANCHAGIDPWGLPFEEYSAGGLLKQDKKIDARSTLPDKTTINSVNELKAYLANQRIDRVAYSILKHLGSYATGRTLTYNEIAFLEEHAVELKPSGYRMRDMVRFIVNSDLFLKK